MNAPAPIRVMIADDSLVVRGMMTKWLREEPGIDLVAAAADGQQAVDLAAQHRPDVLVLDIEMPRLNGLEALPKILENRPRPRVIMASSLTSEGAGVTLQALDLGASDYITKPSSHSVSGVDGYREELMRKIRSLGRRIAPAPPRPTSTPTSAPVAAPSARPPAAATSPARAFLPAEAILVASSTGGPPVLKALLDRLGPDFAPPILIVQHMPATFTGMLAAHLAKSSGRKVVEAVDGGIIESHTAYIAPGGWHMGVAVREGRRVTVLDQSEPENWCRPAADKLFRAAAEVYGPRTLAVVLTGMGHDGLAGARALSAQGAAILAQDEESSVVWGMPGAVAQAGLTAVIGPLPTLVAEIRKRSRV